MAGQNGDGFLQGSDKLVSGLRHGTAEVAHDGARRAEGCRNALDAGKDEFRTFGGRLPGVEHPPAPTGKGGDHRTAAIFTSGVDVKRPAAVGFQSLAQGRGRFPVQRLQINEEALAQAADFARREGDPILDLQIRPDLVALTAVNEAGPPDVHHDVITNLTLGQQKLGQTG